MLHRRNRDPLTDRTQYQAEIEKLVASHALHGSESLCKLLRYLGKQALEHPGVPVKEYQIATEVFGRQPDFDPQLDSMVRVQAGRLRTKLAEYYSTEGASDRFVVEVPKGSYTVAFHERAGTTHGNGSAAGTWATNPVESAASATTRRYLVRGLSFALAAALAMVGWLLWTRRDSGISSASAAADNSAPAPIRIFWRGFVRGTEAPWVIFSNAAFVGRPNTGMRYYDRSKDANSPILDHYTGVGEVLAVHNLDLVFAALHQSLRVKRGSLFSLDDAKNNDLIFIGSPSENLTLLELPNTQEFTFKQITSGPRTGTMEIINFHPESGEPKEFFPSPPDETLTEDYSIIALKRGLNPAHSVLILAGATTIGTQAAVEYVCQQNSLEELLLRLSVSNSGELKPFEAVIRVKVAKGVPVGSELVALRRGPA